ncbi:MAG: FtsQ-type POTRA domain-containing protein [Anaerolineaceae bacterium]|nr:FtsQ-type POTRA domain-containing protein [Anaerolineaceae bacterium]
MSPAENRPLSRSEQVRQRRAQTGQGKKPIRMVYQAHSTAITPSILVRGGRIGTPVVQRAKTKTRRKYSVAMGNTGAEMILPALPIIRPGWRLLSGFLVILMGSLLYFVYTTPQLKVTAPTILGIKRLNASDIQAVLNLTNTPIFMVNTDQATANLAKSFPDLTDISVQIVLPAKVVVSVRERQPAIAWTYNSETVWIDKDGFVFPKKGTAGSLLSINADQAPPLLKSKNSQGSPNTTSTSFLLFNAGSTPAPTAAATSSLKQIDPTILNALISLSKQMPKKTVLAYTGKNGFGWKDPHGWQVFIGSSLDNLDAKLLVYKGIIAQLNKDGIQPSMISVEHIDAPYYRLEQ